MSVASREDDGAIVQAQRADPLAAARSRGRIRQRCRQLVLGLTALLPQFLKRAVYRWGFGYRIGRRVRIGLAYLDCDALIIGDDTSIASGVVFLRCGQVSIGKHVRLGSLNLIAGGVRIDLDDYCEIRRLNFINAIRNHDCTTDPDSSFSLGYGAVITAEHRIDFTDRVAIGRCSVLAGRGTSIWTHNIRDTRPLTIGDHCYVGSESRFAPGACVPDCCLVGLGSVLTKPISRGFGLVAGVPARRIRSLTAADTPMIFGRTRPDLPPQHYPPLQVEDGEHQDA